MTCLSGLSAFPITPTDIKGQINSDQLGFLIDRMLQANVDSIGLLGSSGIYMYLSPSERKKAIIAVQKKVDDKVPLMVGISSLRTDDAIKYAQEAKSLGVSVGLLAPVSYTGLSQDEVFDHFSAVAKQGKLPICIYDNPSTTNFRFSRKLIAQLSRVSGIIGIKNAPPSTSSLQEHFVTQQADVKKGFSCGYSGDWICAQALLNGADTWYSVLGGVLPEICAKLTRAAKIKDAETAYKINNDLLPIWSLFEEYGSLRVVYEMINQLSFAEAILPKPIKAISEEGKQKISYFILDNKHLI